MVRSTVLGILSNSSSLLPAVDLIRVVVRGAVALFVFPRVFFD